MVDMKTRTDILCVLDIFMDISLHYKENTELSFDDFLKIVKANEKKYDKEILKEY